MKKTLALMAILFFLIPFIAQADQTAAKEIPVYIFTQQGCPHCAAILALLDELKNNSYSGIKIYEFDLKAHPEYFSAYQKMAAAYGIDANQVPITYIGGRAIIGEQESTIREAVEYCSLPINECVNPGKYLENILPNLDVNASQSKIKFIGWLVIGAIIIGGGIFIAAKTR